MPKDFQLKETDSVSAMYYYDPKTLVHATVAARSIEPGEEITIPCTTNRQEFSAHH
jgi:hypothetical protein